MGKNKAIDPSLLKILGALDPENAQDTDFLVMKKYASEELERQLAEAAVSDHIHKQAEKQENAEKPPPAPEGEPLNKDPQEVEEKLQRAAAAEQKERKQEVQARNWGLTPKGLRELLPGKGLIVDTFYIEYHPIQQFFRCKYPRTLAASSRQSSFYF